MPNLPFTECYRLLKIDSQSSWNDVRKAYKLIIQKNHPDRFRDNSPEKNLAEEQIKKLNKAYQLLEQYYKKNGRLPDNSATNQTETAVQRKRNKPWQDSGSASTAPQQRTDTKFSNQHYHFDPTQNTASVTKRIFKLMFMMSVIAFTVASSAYLIYKNSISTPQSPNTPANIRIPQTGETGISNKYAAKVAQPIKEPRKESDKFFTVGSSIADVILVQGEPTKIEGNAWYYGESVVYFENGLVTEWQRHPDYPLKAAFLDKRITLPKQEKKHTDKPTASFPWQ